MIDLPFADFRHRVFITRERVKFAHADPYGHLASGRYVDLIMSHRVEALEDVAGFSIMRSAGSGVAFPARNIEVSYLRPAFVGDALEIGSWIAELGTSSFEVHAIVSGATDRKARAAARIHFVTVDAKSGKPVPVPKTLPSSANSNALVGLPMLVDYRNTISGLPDRWTSA
jgi:YbgC/YbaW family acyl-CoA thioester hydrolase